MCSGRGRNDIGWNIENTLIVVHVKQRLIFNFFPPRQITSRVGVGFVVVTATSFTVVFRPRLLLSTSGFDFVNFDGTAVDNLT
jgi:hypothetical protein